MASVPEVVSDMRSQDRQGERQAWMIRSWHLAILRFAVTLDNADRLGVFATAADIDRLAESGGDDPRFRFFRKTSTALCASILRGGQTAHPILRQYLARIDDARLRQAFAVVTGIEPRGTMATQGPARRPAKPQASLWRGLAPRNNVHP